MDEWMNLTEIAKEIHENAVAHGWWEEDRPAYEIIALIHSEWSEALEEYRAGRPMVWYAVNCDCVICKNRPVMHNEICEGYECNENHKPEGIAVELIDGVIRILDYIAACKETHRLDLSLYEYMQPVALPELVAHLHYFTSRSSWMIPCSDGMRIDARILGINVKMAFDWIGRQGLDPLEILKKKHEYNKTRPYRHGGKVC